MVAVVATIFPKGPEAAADQDPRLFLTGVALERRLDEAIGASWSGRQLREVLESIERNLHVCLRLDRRIDPNQMVEWSAASLPLREIVSQLAARHGASVAWLGPVGYIGPPATATRLVATAAERRADVEKLSPELRTTLLATRPLVWPDLTEPWKLLEQLAAEAELRVVNGDLVPYDLLYHGTTPPLTLIDRLTFVAAQFDLTYRIDPAAKTLRLMPMELPTTAAPSTPQTASAAIKEPARTTKPSATGTGKGTEMQVFTLRVQDVPLRKLIDVLRERHGLKIRVDEAAIVAAGLTLDKNTAVNVEKATLAALLEQAAAPLGLHAKQVGDTIEIGPKK
jgi:hypothetical protein